MATSLNGIVYQPANSGDDTARDPHTLLATSMVSRDVLELPEDLGFLHDAIGPVVAGGRLLCSGTPGGGKSRLATQVCLGLGRQDQKTLTLMTEESSEQLKRRGIQMTSDWTRTDTERAFAAMHVECLGDVTQSPDFLIRQVLSRRGTYFGVKLIVLDSIQGHGLAASATKSYAKVLEFGRLCEQNDITLMLICHITKRGEVAGPKALEHSVDASIILRRAMQYSLLSVRKNRFGPPLQRPIPLRIDPVTTRLQLAPHCEPRPAMARTYAGAGTGIMEMQAAVTIPSDGSRGRMTCPGLPRREIEQLVACIGELPDLDFGDLNFAINCRLPGNGGYLPNFGLPLCVALVGSYLRRAVPADHIFIGEVDLFRNIRAIPRDLIHSLRAAIDAGEIELPVTLVVPASAASEFMPSKQVRVVACRSLEEVINRTWPDL